MQIFLPFSSYVKTSACLDKSRLDRQIKNIGKFLVNLDDIDFEPSDDTERLIASAWRGYELTLAWFGMFAVNSWTERFHEGTVQRTRQAAWFKEYINECSEGENHPPPWLTDRDVIRSHRSNLIRKLPARYTDMFPGNPENMPILYPQVVKDGTYRLRIAEGDIERVLRGERTLPEHLCYDKNKNEVVRDG